MDEKKILETIKIFIKKDKLNLDDNLRDLGFDSLDLLDLVLDAEDKFNIKIDDEELIKLETINDLIRVIKNKL